LVAAGVETAGAESVIVSGVTSALFAAVVLDVVVLAAAVFAAVVFAVAVFAAVVFAVAVFAVTVFAAVVFAVVVFAAVVLGAVVLVVRAVGVLGDALAVDADASVDSAAAAVVGGFDSFGWGSATGWVCTTWLAAVFGRAPPVLEGRRGAVFRGALIVFSAVASGSSCSGGGGAELTQLTYQGGRNSACLRGKLPQIRPRKLLRGRSRVDNDIRHRLPLEGVAG
jgi:hypothetical protein